MRCRVLTIAIALALLLALPPSAWALTVRATTSHAPADDDGSREREVAVAVTAAPDEANNLAITRVEPAGSAPGYILVTDTSAPVTAEGGCEQSAPNAARCKEPTLGASIDTLVANFRIQLGNSDDSVAFSYRGLEFVFVDVDAGDGDDAVDVPYAEYVNLRGGPGNDRLSGSDRTRSRFSGQGAHLRGDDGADVLRGGSGNEKLDGGPGDDSLTALGGKDELIGRTGDDVLDGGSGADLLYGSADYASSMPDGGDDTLVGGSGDDALCDYDLDVGSDQFDGGPGFDVAIPSGIGPVHIDLREPGGQGRAGENDVFAGIEGATGTPADDVLLGTDGSNQLYGGGGGNDEVRGLAGDDELGISNGVVAGGRGDDTVGYFHTETAWAEPAIRCGSGHDRIRRTSFGGDLPWGRSAGPLVARDCERLAFDTYSDIELDPLPVRVRRQGRFTFRFTQPPRGRLPMSLTNPTTPFRTLARTRVQNRSFVNLRAPTRVVSSWGAGPVILRARLGKERGEYFPPVARVWRFVVSR